MKEKPWLKHYEGHVPHSIHYPAITLQRFLTDTTTNHPDYIALSFNEIHLTYRELNERVNRFAQALHLGGVKKGDRIAFLLVNSPTYVIAFFAVMKLGAIVVNISVGIQGEELAHCLNGSGAGMVITLDLFAQNIYQVIKKTCGQNRHPPLHIRIGKENPFGSRGPSTTNISGGNGLSSKRGRTGGSGLSRRCGRTSVYQRLHRYPQGRYPDPRQYYCQCAPVRCLDGRTECRQCRGSMCDPLFSCFRVIGLSPRFRTERIPDGPPSQNRSYGHPLPDENQ